MAKTSAKPPILPDLLIPGLSLVFCGTAPGRMSAAQKAYYAHPQNKFWRVLHEAGFTPRLFAASEYALLPEHGIGLTDIAKYVSGNDNQLPPQSLGRDAADALRARIEKHAPKRLAFTSLTGGRRVMGTKAEFGLQKGKIGDTEVWILPSPSPAAHWNWDSQLWHALAAKVRKR
ncbi:MAG TPA: mismatch-specific DNA-glycosylase [Rhizomicrobium sp.]|nr:mismatch-specific DNA-glycosylase [Rhizomicrobium sp.]